MGDLRGQISSWIKEEVYSAQRNGAVLGLSGGLDSAVVAVLAKEALGDKALSLILPCESREEDIRDAELLSKAFGLRTEKIDLTRIYHSLLELLPEAGLIARANLKPRLRMVVLYYFANRLNYLVLGSGNRSELAVGYFTKYGDGACDLLPLGGLYKSQVRSLAQELSIPEQIISKPPSAGLWPGQTDEGELGIGYEALDQILAQLDEGGRPEGLPEERIGLVESLQARSRHKRSLPKIFTPRL